MKVTVWLGAMPAVMGVFAFVTLRDVGTLAGIDVEASFWGRFGILVVAGLVGALWSLLYVTVHAQRAKPQRRDLHRPEELL